jgi:glycosyltransferase 2 family protein
VVLLVGLGTVVMLLAGRLSEVNRLFLAPIVEQLGRVPLALLAALLFVVVVLMAAVYRQALARDSYVQRLWKRKLQPVVASFRDGLLTLLRARQRVLLISTTLLMWFCYLLMAHIPFVMLGMTGPSGLSFIDSWSIMILGAVGVAIPSPGGMGSYHYITIQSLVHLFGVQQAPAATYAVVAWTAQLVLYSSLGAVSLFRSSTSLRGLRSRAADNEVEVESTPAPKKAPTES